MKVRPILFSAAMVRAILASSKSQTRRAVKFPLRCLDTGCELAGSELAHELRRRPELCPYGKPGDLLYVRETWGINHYEYCRPAPIPKTRPPDVDGLMVYFATDTDAEVQNEMPRCPGIHMPRWASRLTLRITDVHVERLQDISEADAIAEGIRRDEEGNWLDYAQEGWGGTPYPRRSYESLWESINGRESWPANPWVWAISFEVFNENVDAYITRKGITT